MGNHLRRLGSKISIDMPTDENGYLGRECPACESYFKVTPGTGLKSSTEFFCPYCGHHASSSEYWTKDQITYARSVALQKVSDAVLKDITESARSFNRRQSGGLISMKATVKTSRRDVRYYVEKDLETHLDCAMCTLRYSIFGVFGHCPDCGVHNSLQILDTNLKLIDKQVRWALSTDEELREHLIGDALENVVSAFDGFGRTIVHRKAKHASDPKKAGRISFQNLSTAARDLEEHFGIRLSGTTSDKEWLLLVRCFQKRHLLAHCMGVIDEKYVKSTGDTTAIVGRKIKIDAAEIEKLVAVIAKLGNDLSATLESLFPDDLEVDPASVPGAT